MRIPAPVEKLTAWQRIFLQSKANGAPYNGDALEQYKWQWPKGTYFQRRLDQSELFKSSERSKGRIASIGG